MRLSFYSAVMVAALAYQAQAVYMDSAKSSSGDDMHPLVEGAGLS